MLNKYPYATKLQLSFLPLIIAPVLFMTALISLTVPRIIISSRQSVLELQLDQAYLLLSDGYSLLESAGIQNDVFFRQTRQARIVEAIQNIDLRDASFVLYTRERNGFLIAPAAPDAFLSILDNRDLSHLPIAQDLYVVRDSRILHIFRYFHPWNMLVGIQIDIPDLYRPVTLLLIGFGSSGLFIIAVSILLIRLFSRGLTTPITRLVETVGEFGSGDFHRRFTYDGRDEIAMLGDSFNTMADRISNFARELENRVVERTKALEYNIEMLQHTQHQLIESEKLASLGSVVAGVAHEINTPLGVGITSASFLGFELQQMEQKFRAGTLTKTEMEQILKKSRESLDILEGNLNRAQMLVQSFKEVSADQLVDEKRDFDFCSYLSEILSSLYNQVKRHVKEIAVEGPEQIEVHSHPGAFWQIFSNLVQNSLNHAFPASLEREPRIHIALEVHKSDLNIIFSDNGVGMDEGIRKTAFEPFVTTKRGRGGTGLGLNIVFNIIQRLGGTVSIESGTDGTSIYIQIPGIITSHEKEQAADTSGGENS